MEHFAFAFAALSSLSSLSSLSISLSIHPTLLSSSPSLPPLSLSLSVPSLPLVLLPLGSSRSERACWVLDRGAGVWLAGRGVGAWLCGGPGLLLSPPPGSFRALALALPVTAAPPSINGLRTMPGRRGVRVELEPGLQPLAEKTPQRTCKFPGVVRHKAWSTQTHTHTHTHTHTQGHT